MDRQYDVIVVGGGGAGMSAALMAHEGGARVLLVEAGDRLGGSTALSGGVVYAAGTSVQRERGIVDSPDAAYAYSLTLNQYKVAPALVRRLCDESPPAIDWLIGLGVEFRPENLYQAGVDGVERGHRATDQGAGIAAALEAAISRTPVDVALRSRVDGLLRGEDGSIQGIRVDGFAIAAGAVVLATGGFGANPELLARHYPEAAAHSDWSWYIGVPECRGDALALTEPLGVELSGHNRGLLLLTPGFAKQVEPYPPGWLVYVNRDGRRFIAETTEYAVTSGVVKEQLAGECFAIFDEKSRLAAKAPPPTPKNPWPGTWDADQLESLAGQGRLLRADSLEELAVKAGIRPSTLQTTMERYNLDCAAGSDGEYFKPAAMLRPVAAPPFYAARLRPAVVCLTSFGPRIDPDARVLRRDDRPAPGLYAAGEASGGVLGERYVGGGNSIANAIVYGRIAGSGAARFSQS